MDYENEYLAAIGSDGKEYLIVKRTPIETTRDLDGKVSQRRLLADLRLEDDRQVTPISKTEFQIVGTKIILKLK